MVSGRLLGAMVMLVVAVVVAGGCAFTARDAVEYGVAKDQPSAIENLRAINDFVATQQERVSDRHALIHAWRSGAALVVEHGIERSHVEYQRLFGSLMATASDRELVGWQHEALGKLGDPGALAKLIWELDAPSMSSAMTAKTWDSTYWQFLVQTARAIVVMADELDERPEELQNAMLALSRLDVGIDESSVGANDHAAEIKRIHAHFMARYASPKAVAEAIEYFLDPMGFDKELLALVLQAHNVFLASRATSDAGSRPLYGYDELVLLVKALGLVVERDGPTAHAALAVLMEHAPVHGADVLLEHWRRSRLPGPRDRVVKAIGTLAWFGELRVELESQRRQHTIWQKLKAWQVLAPRNLPTGRTLVELEAALVEAGTGLLGRMDIAAWWHELVASMALYDRSILAKGLAAVSDGVVLDQKMGREYVTAMLGLLAELKKEPEISDAIGLLQSRLESCVAYPMRGVATSIAAVSEAEWVVRVVYGVLDGQGPNFGEATVDVVDERVTVYLDALGRFDRGDATTHSLEDGAWAGVSRYHILGKALAKMSGGVRQSTIEFLISRDRAMGIRIALDAFKADAMKMPFDVTSVVYHQLREASRFIGDELERECLAVMAKLLYHADDDHALVAARCLVESKHDAAKEAVRLALESEVPIAASVRKMLAVSSGKRATPDAKSATQGEGE